MSNANLLQCSRYVKVAMHNMTIDMSALPQPIILANATPGSPSSPKVTGQEEELPEDPQGSPGLSPSGHRSGSPGGSPKPHSPGTKSPTKSPSPAASPIHGANARPRPKFGEASAMPPAPVQQGLPKMGASRRRERHKLRELAGAHVGVARADRVRHAAALQFPFHASAQPA